VISDSNFQPSIAFAQVLKKTLKLGFDGSLNVIFKKISVLIVFLMNRSIPVPSLINSDQFRFQFQPIPVNFGSNSNQFQPIPVPSLVNSKPRIGIGIGWN
jgi:hypothetical protein